MRTVHREQPPQKNLSTGVARTEESKENDLPLDVHVGPHIIQGEIPVNDITFRTCLELVISLREGLAPISKIVLRSITDTSLLSPDNQEVLDRTSRCPSLHAHPWLLRLAAVDLVTAGSHGT